MSDFDRITTDNWTIAFPNDWVEQAQEDGTLYLESAEGDKGVYVALWQMSDQESHGPKELIESFQETELDSFFPKEEGWEILRHDVDASSSPVMGYWEGINRDRTYRISGKQFAAGKLVLRATFHDYDCTNYERSIEFFSPIVDSLKLLGA